MTINKLHVIKKDDMYIGEIILDGKIVETIPAHLNASNCARTLNARVTQVATLKNIQLPRLVVSKPEEPIYFELTKNSYKIIKKAKTDTVKKETPDAVTQTAQRVPPHPSPLKPKAIPRVSPRRKPFTPYGLNGYLVDKNGNIRLMLDRKASANTIVLEPQMFEALADMVKMTQSQGE
ncbi:Uncharacterised protein [[Actinobacillus] rossii]|uniref:Uncharacterized protein n=1 Tax=[Actinobacillus] rossii TaxID=123820 RepID=A0A380TZQ7_9PAST|nr:Uncharacterised protein [[Actinobacillus] rossii]